MDIVATSETGAGFDSLKRHWPSCQGLVLFPVPPRKSRDITSNRPRPLPFKSIISRYSIDAEGVLDCNFWLQRVGNTVTRLALVAVSCLGIGVKKK
jgi:hypothetical protein